jgi:hypothetical protein
MQELAYGTYTPPVAPSSSLPPAPPPDAADDPEKLYISLKQVEDKFPFPTPAVTLHAGYFFQGGVPDGWPDSMSGPPVHFKGPPGAIDVNAVNITLRYELWEGEGTTVNAKVLSVGSGGVSIPPPPLPPAVRMQVVRFGITRTFLLLNVGGRTYSRDFGVEVELSSGGAGTEIVKQVVVFGITRPPLLGMGAYTMPVVPVAIVYEPPQDMNKKNTVTYTEVKSVGTTIKSSVSTEDSTTVPAYYGYDEAKDLGNGISALSTTMGTTAPMFGPAAPYMAGLAVILKLISTGLGNHTVTDTDDTKVQSDHTVTVTCAETDVYPTTLHQGPGLGDRILTRINAHVAWLANPDGGITLYVLPGSTRKSFPVSQLLSDLAAPSVQPSSRLDRETIQALVNLDPFAAGGPDAELPEPRFCKEASWEVNWENEKHQVTHTVTQDDLITAVNFKTRAEDQTPGWMAFFGVGITEEKHSKHTLTCSGSRSVSIGESVTIAVEFYANADAHETYRIQSYYDRVFGTFAFKRAPLSSNPAISGTVVDASGQPAARQLATLEIGGRKYSTLTDRQGHYTLRASDIPAGAGSLTVGGAHRAVVLPEGVTLKCDLRLP